MPYTAPTVSYSATSNGTYTALTGVLNVSISRGRQRFQDNFNVTSCNIELIPANSYALPLAVGQYIDVRTSNSVLSPCYFVGKITDVERVYDFPYSAGTGAAPADRIRITAVGGTGQLAATELVNYSLTAGLISNRLVSLGFAYGFDVTLGSSSNNCSAQTYTGKLFDLIQSLSRTSQYMINEYATLGDRGKPSLQFIAPGYGWSTPLVYSDAGTVGAQKYNRIQYLSSVQSTFTQVTVEPQGLTPQTVTTGSAPFNSLSYQTLSATTGDALDLANYLLAISDSVTPTPFTLTTSTIFEDTATDVAIVRDGFTEQKSTLGRPVQVLFRGTTVNAIIQGVNTVFYPDYAQVQLYLSPSLGQAFILDSSAFGVLDTNRLGFI
jgi:hypothetical protein